MDHNQVLSDKRNISHQNQVDKPQFDVMRDVTVENFPLVIWPVSRVLQIETKIS